MDLQSQIDLYVKNIFDYLELEEELMEDSVTMIRNSVLLRAFEAVINEKYDGEAKKRIEEIIKQQNQEELEKLINEDNLQEDIQKQIEKQFINVVGELLIELNKDNYIPDEKLDELTSALQDPEKQKELFPDLQIETSKIND